MSDAHERGEDKVPGSRGAHAFVGSAGEPSEMPDTPALAARDDQTPTHEDLDAREKKFSGPRKPMGPAEAEDDPAETVPEEEG